MTDELESVLRLVADGRLTPEEAAPIVAALDEGARWRSRGQGQADSAAAAGATARADGQSHDRPPRGGGIFGAFAGARSRAGDPRVAAALSGRRLRIFVAEAGRQVVDFRIPLVAAGFALDRVPGLSPDDRVRIAEAVRTGMTGSILEVDDDGDEVRIVIE